MEIQDSEHVSIRDKVGTLRRSRKGRNSQSKGGSSSSLEGDEGVSELSLFFKKTMLFLNSYQQLLKKLT